MRMKCLKIQKIELRRGQPDARARSVQAATPSAWQSSANQITNPQVICVNMKFCLYIGVVLHYILIRVLYVPADTAIFFACLLAATQRTPSHMRHVCTLMGWITSS